MMDDNFKFNNILSEVIWIHKNKFKDSNQMFVSFLNKRNLKFIEAFDVPSGIAKIKEIKFKCIYVIVSGSMFSDFIKLFKQNINQISCIPVITIFTMEKSKYEKVEYVNHPFFNPGGIHILYEELILNFIKFDSIISKKIEKNIISPEFNNQCFNFEKIDSIPKLYFPFIYSQFIEEVNDNEIFEFNKNILKYDNNEITNLIYPLTFLNKIPIEILVKFWLRIYTLETDFYSNMNCKLMKLKGNEFYTYIKLMYLALNKKILKNRCDICLYRGDILNNNELNMIINKISSNSIKDKLIYSRKFLSFSASQNIAEDFLRNKYHEQINSINYILFKIEQFNGNIEDAKCYNIDMSYYTNFKSEDEYLFLPYSPFILNGIEKFNLSIDVNLTITINLINLYYIGTYKCIIQESMKNISSLDDLSFELLEKYFLEEIKKYKIFENEKNIWEKLKNIIKKNDF